MKRQALAALACLGLLGMPGLPGWAMEARSGAVFGPEGAPAIDVAALQAAIEDVGAPLFSAEDGAAQALAGLESSFGAPQAPQAMAARVLAIAVAEPGFIDGRQAALARLLGESRLQVLKAKAAALAADKSAKAQIWAVRGRLGPDMEALELGLARLGAPWDGARLAAGEAESAPAVLGAVPDEIAALRADFNARYTPALYRRFLHLLASRLGVPYVPFRVGDTPVFLPKAEVDQMARDGQNLALQVTQPNYLQIADAAIPEEFRTPGAPDHPTFFIADYNRTLDGNWPLVELQGFASLFGFQAVVAQAYMDVFGLDSGLQYLLGGLDMDGYIALLRQVIVGDSDPANVVLMEFDPLAQKTYPDLAVTAQWLGIPIVSVANVEKDGNKLYYRDDQRRRVRIERIFNRIIPDEVKGMDLPFKFTDALDVTWVEHPRWYFRASKLALPHLDHPRVPRTRYLDQVEDLERMIRKKLARYVIKPMFSFAGHGVQVPATPEGVARIPRDERWQYVLQEFVDFVPFIPTPLGPTKAEVRILYVWLKEEVLPRPVTTLARIGREALMGVSANDFPWAGSSAILWRP
ncbi:MAG: hypothetical protein HY552_06560 [Elusimicrobia bacterium]|nr:hypothetical protein [Elusimicrobiota bacterium]